MSSATFPSSSPARLARRQGCRTKRYQVRANWKIIAENFSECYHCGPTQPGILADRWLCLALDSRRPLRKRPNASPRRGSLEGQSLYVGVMSWRRRCDSRRQTSPVAQGPRQSEPGWQAVAPLMGTLPTGRRARHVDDAAELLPEMTTTTAGLRREPKSATLTEMEVSWLVRDDAVEAFDYDVDRLTAFCGPQPSKTGSSARATRRGFSLADTNRVLSPRANPKSTSSRVGISTRCDKVRNLVILSLADLKGRCRDETG